MTSRKSAKQLISEIAFLREALAKAEATIDKLIEASSRHAPPKPPKPPKPETRLQYFTRISAPLRGEVEPPPPENPYVPPWIENGAPVNCPIDRADELEER